MQDDAQRAVVAIADTADQTKVLLASVSGDLKQMAVSGRKLTGDAAQIAEGIRNGKGAIGKLVNDDELYTRATAVATQAEEIAANARKLVDNAKTTLEGFQSKDGPIQGMTADVKQAMDDARSAMAAFAENMEALKHNFLLRGFFKGRGYFDLAQLSPADYRKGALTKGSDRRVVRVWRLAGGLFEPEPDHVEGERLTDPGKAWLDSAIAPHLEHVASGIVIIEGYAQRGTRDEQYLRSRARASMVRDYLIGKFHLDPQSTGAMPLGAASPESPGKAPWDGVAVAVILPKAAVVPIGSTR
jgi:hypothetical protein